MTTKTATELRSARWFAPDDFRSFGHRSRVLQMGYAPEDWRGKPVIAIVNTWSDANQCHAHFKQRVDDVKRKMLMDTLGLGYGDANALALQAQARVQAAAAPTESDPLDAIYSGNKTGLRALHGQIESAIAKLGPFERAPKKSYVSLRRSKQFAMLGPATKDAIGLGLNVKQLPPSPRLKRCRPPACASTPFDSLRPARSMRN